MIVSRASWHFRVWNEFRVGPMPEEVSWRSYWGTVFLAAPVTCVIAFVTYPLVWCADRLEKACGRIRFKR
jgi:hypothetical protein